MHPAVEDFVKRSLTAESVCGANILEVGSYDVNGSVRPYLESLKPEKYIGVDMQSGPGVDMVVDCERLVKHMGGDVWDIVVSTEMLEHVDNWRICVRQMVWAVAPGGWWCVTTRSPGFPYHPFPVDNWRFTRNNMEQIIEALRMEAVVIEDDPQAPGVFMLARKPHRLYVPGSLEHIWVEGVSA
jgi:hypothetical protein